MEKNNIPCVNCKLRARYDKSPKSLLGRFWRWHIVDWYDCFILDWVFFARIKAIRLPGTEHMDRAYHQKKYHFVRSLWGMLIGLIPCLLGAALYTLFI